MSTNHIGGYSEKRMNTSNANSQLEKAKALNRPVIRLAKGVTGEMYKPKKQKVSNPNKTISIRAEEYRNKALPLLEQGLPFKKIAKLIGKQPNTVSGYFKYWVERKGVAWGRDVRAGKDQTHNNHSD